MNNYTPIFTITPEILSFAYDIAADLELIDIIQEKAFKNADVSAGVKLSITQ